MHVSTNVDQRSLETKFLIAICRQSLFMCIKDKHDIALSVLMYRCLFHIHSSS